jgi:hypothetical protein
MGTDGLLFCVAKRSGAFPPNMPAGLRARVSRLSAVSRGRSPGNFPSAGARLFVITDEAVTLMKFALRLHRAGFEPQRASSFVKSVKAPKVLGDAARA